MSDHHPAASPVIVYANWYQFAPGERIHHPRVESRMLLWCKAGHGRVTLNGSAGPFAPGDYAILPWGHRVTYEANGRRPFRLGGVHVIPAHGSRHPVEFAVAHDRSHHLAGCPWRNDDGTMEAQKVRAGRFEAHAALEHLAEYVVTRFAGSSAHDEAEMRGLAALVLAEIARCPAAHEAACAIPPTLLSIMRRVVDAPDRPHEISTLAMAASCSTPTLRRMFRTHLAMSPLEYISQCRLRHAEHLLRSTSLPVNEIASRVGFEDAFYFSRWFRKQRGHSPREARKRSSPL